MNHKLKNKIIESLEDLKAVNPVVIEVKKVSTFTDYMVIASGTSNRHITAISEKVIESLKGNFIFFKTLYNFFTYCCYMPIGCS